MHIKCKPSYSVTSVNQPACHCPWHKMEYKDLLPSPPAREGTQRDISQQTSTNHPSTVTASQAQPRASGKPAPRAAVAPKNTKEKQYKSAYLKRNCWLNIKYLSFSSYKVLHIK